jgi:hypothetical protein
MVEAKTKWIGDGDDFLDEYQYPRDISDSIITLEA